MARLVYHARQLAKPAIMDRMQCPRCKSERIQRDYDDAIIFLRVVGMHKLLCNNCGLGFKGFDPQRKLQRVPTQETEHHRNRRRRAPRYGVHLPAAISLIEGNIQVGKASYSQPSRGHCETISKTGMRLSLVGTRFAENERPRACTLLLFPIHLPQRPAQTSVLIS